MGNPNTAAGYRIVGVAPLGVPVDQFVVDTNVVSHVEALVRGGEANEATAKASSLLRYLAAHPEIGVIDDFAWVEGSSFRRLEGLSPTSIVMRDIAAQIILDRPVDLVATVKDLDGWMLPDGYEKDVQNSLDQMISGLLFTVVPSYIAALVLERRYGDCPASGLTVDDVAAVLDVLSAEFNYVPGMLIAALRLACAGTTTSRTTVMRVLKTGRKSKNSTNKKTYDPIRNALSAAWDLGVLQLLSAKLSTGVNAMLVTEDSELANLANLITVEAGLVVVHPDAYDDTAAGRDRARQVDDAHLSRRAGVVPSLPDRGAAARVIRAAEMGVSGQSSFPDVLERGIQVAFPTLAFDADDLERVLAMLASNSLDEKRQRLGELLYGDQVVLQGRFDATFAASNAIVEIIQTNRQVTLTEVLQPLAQRDDHGYSVATALAAFAYAHEAPYRATLYRELLCRPASIRGKLMSVVAGVFSIADDWAPSLGASRKALTAAARDRVMSTWTYVDTGECEPIA